MKKGLLVLSVILLIALPLMVSSCSDSRVTTLQQQYQDQSGKIQQLESSVSQLTQYVQIQQNQINTLQNQLQQTLTQINNYLATHP